MVPDVAEATLVFLTFLICKWLIGGYVAVLINKL